MENINSIDKTEKNWNGIPFSEECLKIFDLCNNSLFEEFPTLTINLDYFLFACLVDKKNNLYKRLENSLMSSAIDSIYDDWYQLLSSKAINAIKPNRIPTFEADFFRVLLIANDEAIILHSNFITTEHVFLAILKDQNNKISIEFRKKCGLTFDVFRDLLVQETKLKTNNKNHKSLLDGVDIQEIIEIKPTNNSNHLIPGKNRKPSENNSYVETYCTNLNRLAEENKITNII